MFQGVILKEEQREKRREKEKQEWHGKTKLRWARLITLFSKGTFIPWLVHRGKWKMQSHPVSPNITSVLSLSKPGFFLHTFPINNIVYNIFWLWRPVDILWLFLIKVDQPENLFSLKVFFLYFSQPQKVLNRVTFSWSKGAVGHNKERTNQLKGLMWLIPRLLLVFLTFQLC